ncbi:MAG: carboxyl transferase domain-containing protein [Acidimicrobiales bacterium]
MSIPSIRTAPLVGSRLAETRVPVWQAGRVLVPLTEEWDRDLRSGDPLGFPGYADAVATLDGESVRTGLADGFVLIEGDFGVIGGSMGLVHGEKVVRAFDRAIAARLPVVVVTRSGGARMQEGMVSLVQMARTAAAAGRHRAAGLLRVAVHQSPTTGGVLASYGSLADVTVAEVGATIGFAGPRVVESIAGEEVTGRSHSAETAFAAHLVDAVAEPGDVLAWVRGALGQAEVPLPVVSGQVPVPQRPPAGGAGPSSTETNAAWEEVLASRRPGRPSGITVAAAATTSWTELAPGTDPALRVALATVAGQRVVAIASDRYAADGGRPGPAAYRLVQRGIHLADRLGLAVVSFVDLTGADPRPEAENGGIAREIAATLAAVAALRSVSVSICVGEGGSGGALAIAAADRLLIQEHAIFSVIGPEGAAAILERDAGRAAAVAPSLHLTAGDLLELGMVDAVVGEGVDDAVAAVVKALGQARPGDRERRFDAVTRRWLRTS